MNRAETAEAAMVMQAWAHGADIEFRQRHGSQEWTSCEYDGDLLWSWNVHEYRIKPAPKVVPWTASSFPKDRPVWVRGKCDVEGYCTVIVDVSQEGVRVVPLYGEESCNIPWDALYDDWEQHDGSICGVVEE